MPLIFDDPRRTRNEPDYRAEPVTYRAGERPPPLEIPVDPATQAGGLDIAAAAFRQANVVGSLYDRLANYSWGEQPVEGYDPIGDIAGYEEHWRQFVESDSPAETQRIKEQIDRETWDMRVLSASGGVGIASMLAAGVLDPATIVSMMLPVAPGAGAAAGAAKVTRLAKLTQNFTRAERIWAGIAAQATVDTASELVMHQTQQLRTATDSVINVGAGALLTGVLGRVATRVPKEEFDATVRAMEAARGRPLRLLHGTTPENAALIRSSGRFDADAGTRQYDYSTLGEDTIYFTTPEMETTRTTGKLWLGRNAGDRMAAYSEVVEAELAPDARVLRFTSLEDVRAFTTKFLADNEDLVQELRKAAGIGDDVPPEDVFMRLVGVNDLKLPRGSRPANTRAAKAMARLRQQYDAFVVEPDIEGLASEAEAFFGMPQVAVINPDKVRLAGAVNRSGSGSFGAARVGDNTTLADEGIATAGGRAVAKTLGAVSPLTRVLQATARGARRLVQDLVDIPYLLGKNLRGEATPESLESVIKMRTGQARVEMANLLRDTWRDYRAAGGKLTRAELRKEISRALSNGDRTDIAQIKPIIKWARERFNRDAAEIRDLAKQGTLGKEYENFGEDVIGAETYFMRQYDYEAILSDLHGFKRRLFDWYKANPLIAREGAVARERVLAERRAGVSDAQINLEIAQRDAEEALKAYEQAKKLRAQARAAAYGKGGARQELSKAKRAAQAKAREVKRLRRAFNALQKRLADLQSQPIRDIVDIETELRTTHLLRKDLGKQMTEVAGVGRSAAKKARRLAQRVRGFRKQIDAAEAKADALIKKGDPSDVEKATKASRRAQILRDRVARDEAALTEARAAMADSRARLAAMRAKSDELAEQMADLRAQRTIQRSREAGLKPAEDRMHMKGNALQEAESELVDAERLRGRLKEKAKVTRQIVRELKQPYKTARKAKYKTARIARKAEPRFLDDAEITAKVNDTVNNILGDVRNSGAERTVSRAGPMKERALDVPDNVLEPYMVRDFHDVMESYNRRMIAHIEMLKKFGSLNMQPQIKQVVEEYDALMDAAKPDMVKALSEERDRVIKDLERMRDRLLGHSTQVSDQGAVRQWVRANRILRTYNYVRLLGSQTLSSISDPGKLLMRYGLPKTLHAMGAFLTNPSFRNLTREAAHRIAIATDVVIDTVPSLRSAQMADIASELSSVRRTDKAMDWAAAHFSRLSLMSHWNAGLKLMTAALEQDELIRLLRKAKLSKADTARLAQAHITPDVAASMRKMLDLHAENSSGLWRAATEKWGDEQAAGLFERHLLNTSEQVVTMKGAGDLPLLMDNETIKTLLQFRTFAIASVNRTLIPLAQGLSMKDARAAQGALALMTLGSMSYAAREYAAGRMPDTSPGRLAMESLNLSGLLAFVPDVYDPLNPLISAPLKAMGLLPDDMEALPRFSRFQSRSPFESVLGPSWGTMGALAYGWTRSWKDGLSQDDIHRLRQLLPAQNLFYIRRLFNALEGEIGEALGVEGATRQSFTDRMAETVPSKEAR